MTITSRNYFQHPLWVSVLLKILLFIMGTVGIAVGLPLMVSENSSDVHAEFGFVLFLTGVVLLLGWHWIRTRR